MRVSGQETPMPDALLPIPRAHRLVYVLGVALAGRVGAFGTFAPEHVDWALPWLLPPLHARSSGRCTCPARCSCSAH